MHDPNSGFAAPCMSDADLARARSANVVDYRALYIHPRQPWEDAPGIVTHLPYCGACQRPLVWRGAWVCAGCATRGHVEADKGARALLSLPPSACAGVPIFSSPEGTNSTDTIATWRWSVEALTSFHRRSRAAHFRVRGTRRVEYVDDDGVFRDGTSVLNRWHEQRMQGQADRFQRIAECGSYEYAVELQKKIGDATLVVPVEKRCDCWRACPRCLNKRKWRLSEGMKRARARVLRVHGRQFSRGYRGKEGRWSEKLITFTVPHGESPAHDAEVLRDSWPKLLRKLRAHLVSRGCTVLGSNGKAKFRSVPWCRALELAPGQTGGHAHLHVWWAGPFVENALLRVWWGGLMLEAGRATPRSKAKSVLRPSSERRAPDARLAGWLGNPTDDTELPWPVVDIRTGGGGAISAYTSKVGIALYITKGSESHRLSPAHAALMYEAFEGVRAVQWARGWSPPKKAEKNAVVTFRRLTEDEKRAIMARIVSSTGAPECGGKTSEPSATDVGASTNGSREPISSPPHATAGPTQSCVTVLIKRENQPKLFR